MRNAAGGVRSAECGFCRAGLQSRRRAAREVPWVNVPQMGAGGAAGGVRRAALVGRDGCLLFDSPTLRRGVSMRMLAVRSSGRHSAVVAGICRFAAPASGRGTKGCDKLHAERRMSGDMKVRFGEYVLDVPAYKLEREGRRVRIERRPMDVLIFLIEQAGRLVSREEIVERFWGADAPIDIDIALNSAIKKVRQALRDHVGSPAYIETVQGKGYRAALHPVPSGRRTRAPSNTAAGIVRAQWPRALERALEVRDVHLIFLAVDPKWDPLRQDQRFQRLVERCGFVGR